MTTHEIPDYTDDWKRYWEFRYGQRVRTRLKKAAENPTQEFLPVKPSQLNPSSEDHEWAIEIQHLRESPDAVLNDARSGFQEFVLDNEITEEEGDSFDVLPVNFTEDHFHLRDHFWSARTLGRLEPNMISSISVNLTGPVEKSLIPAAVSYECPEGHSTRIVQPMYTHQTIDICAKGDCNNSVYPTSQNSQLLTVIRFDALFNESEVEIVSAGINVEDRIFEELSESEGSLNAVGILRNVVKPGHQPKRIFGALNTLTS